MLANDKRSGKEGVRISCDAIDNASNILVGDKMLRKALWEAHFIVNVHAPLTRAGRCVRVGRNDRCRNDARSRRE